MYSSFNVIIFLVAVSHRISQGLPILDDMVSLGEEGTSDANPQNESLKNLYVIKAVVYEIGILTDSSDEDNITSSETQERVDLTFFDAHSNGTHIDLGRIPLPVQTNISGQVLTALAPIDIGAFSNPSDLLQMLPLTGTIVNITHSDTALFRIRTSNTTENEEPYLITSDDIAEIPDVADVLPELTISDPEITSEDKNENGF